MTCFSAPTSYPAANQNGPATPKLYPTRVLPNMAVLQSHDDITAEAVNPVPTDRFAVMNISVVLLSSPAVLFSKWVVNIMIKAIKKPTAITTT